MEHLSKIRLLIFTVVAACFFVAMPAFEVSAELSASYKYNLANFSGTVPYMWALLATDPANSEVYVMDPGDRDIRIFNETGMEIFRFGEEGEFAWAKDLTVDEEGNIYLLSLKSQGFTITQCNFRGEPISEIQVEGMPDEFAGIRPELMNYTSGKLYLVDPMRLSIVVVDLHGRFDRGFDAKKMIKELEENDARKKKRARIERNDQTTINDITGFGVDSNGNMYFTISTMFAAFRLSPDGKLGSFGKPGSTRGSFGVAAGIGADDMGYIYVADKLRCVVIVFDQDFKFVTEFGFRGFGPGNLIVPNEIAVARDGRVFVSQAANRGVSVYTVSHN